MFPAYFHGLKSPQSAVTTKWYRVQRRDDISSQDGENLFTVMTVSVLRWIERPPGMVPDGGAAGVTGAIW